MHEPDQEKETFITNHRLYCYKVMPFRLKNARATCQHLVNNIFKEQIGRTMEVYIDNIIIKLVQASNHAWHLKDIFTILRQHNKRFNPEKYAFEVTFRKFLGFIVQKR